MADVEKKIADPVSVPESDVAEGSLEAVVVDQRMQEDIGAQLYLEVQQYSKEELEAERKKVLRKIDRVILPIICITYTLQFLDKLSLNYASAYSLKEDLGLGGQRYSWTASIFNFGYLFWAIPSNLLIQKLPVAKFTGGMLLVWAVILVCHVAAKDFAGMMVLRFTLGMFEAGISPAIMNITSMFYTRSEQPLRMCLFLAFNGMATMVGALLGYGLGHATDHSLKAWQLIFLVIGALNFAWGVVFLWLMPDAPSAARFLTHKERVVAVHRIAENMMGVKNTRFLPRQAAAALADAKVWCLVFIGCACGIINGGVSNFASSLIKGFGFSGISATLLQLPTGAIEFVVVPLCGVAAGRWRDVRCWLLMAICLPPLGGLIGIRLTSLDERWSLVGCTWLQYIVGAPVILAWNLMTSNIAGHSKRTMTNGLWFVWYAAGNIVGAQLFFAREAPRYESAIIALCVCYAAIIVLAFVLRQVMWWENKRRDKAMGVGERTVNGADEAAMKEGFRDQTDVENKHFRYCL
ncbi:mfs allantoate transporter [Diplodia corticola]|uniref:Mfs allantoate transporter n=1 Tax=Diplodia corticola TaxID=236234 RepID=A0A1J9QR12_9PEZI|nr:mfs allantoate transporter [Diplodia corticola]OJD31382.1 mfs allantoate transporter [Diplodia corticola]